MRVFTALTLLLLIAASAQAQEAGITRTPLPNGSKFPIALAVEVPARASTIYISGIGADPLPGAGNALKFGDTETQARSALIKISKVLNGLGLNLSNVVQVHVYLAGDPVKNGKLDFAGLQKAWVQFFGTQAQPNLPARSAFQVASLANPAWLVEIEVIAARP